MKKTASLPLALLLVLGLASAVAAATPSHPDLLAADDDYPELGVPAEYSEVAPPDGIVERECTYRDLEKRFAACFRRYLWRGHVHNGKIGWHGRTACLPLSGDRDIQVGFQGDRKHAVDSRRYFPRPPRANKTDGPSRPARFPCVIAARKSSKPPAARRWRE